MKNTLKTIVVAAFVVAACLTMAQGQGRGGMRMGRGNLMSMMLGREDVQKELALTDEQKTKLEEMRKAQQEEMQAKFQNAGNGGDRAAMMKEVQEMMKKGEAEALALLTDPQKKRLKELWIQKTGNGVLSHEDIQKDLGMTDAQKAKIKSLEDAQTQANQEIRQKIQDGSLDRTEARPLMEKNQKIMMDELGKVLTSDQADKLKKMGGAEFKFDEDNGGN